MSIKIIKSSFELLDVMGNCKTIVDVFKDIKKQYLKYNSNVSERALIDYLKESLKTVSFTFNARLNRLQSLLMVENLDSYSIQSQRYCTYNKDSEIILDNDFEEETEKEIIKYVETSLNIYQDMCNKGIKPEDARYILPMVFPCYNIITLTGDKLIDLIKIFYRYQPIFIKIITDLYSILPCNLMYTIIETMELNYDYTQLMNLSNDSFDKLFRSNSNYYTNDNDIQNDLLDCYCEVHCSPLSTAGIAALTCTNEKSVDELLKEYSVERLCKTAKFVSTNLGHTSIAEHVKIESYITLSLPSFNQLVRHRHQKIKHFEFDNIFERAILGDCKKEYITPESFKENKYDDVYITLQYLLKEISLQTMLFAEIDMTKIKLILSQLIPFGKKEKFIINSNLINELWVCSKRTCNTSQWEIRNFTYKKLKQISEQIDPSSLLNAKPECLKTKCKEGKKCCGKQQEVNKRFKSMGIE